MVNSDKKEWFVVSSKHHREELAQFHLRLKGLETFFPRLMLPRFSYKSKQFVPLFPNYLFVHINLAADYDQVRWTPGVKSFVIFGGSPTPLQDEIAETLMRQADHEGIIPAHSNLKIGQEVQIRGGPFDGVIGVIQRTPDAKGRVRLLMKLLSRRIAVEIPVHLISGGWLANRAHPVDANRSENRPELPILI
ncbi:MAG: transcription termination/antitermination NusG family protein [Deltaproteobacteria bacterium]|nr:transcription termination/antitermination NusG family protein [Deltaproteobacteria bacterium]